MKRLLFAAVRWLCDVKPQGRCAPDGLGHYFGDGATCECGDWPTTFDADRAPVFAKGGFVRGPVLVRLQPGDQIVPKGSQ